MSPPFPLVYPYPTCCVMRSLSSIIDPSQFLFSVMSYLTAGTGYTPVFLFASYTPFEVKEPSQNSPSPNEYRSAPLFVRGPLPLPISNLHTSDVPDGRTPFKIREGIISMFFFLDQVSPPRRFMMFFIFMEKNS